MNNTIVIGLAFGDEAKGATVDYLCSLKETHAVVRFCGGPQTAHNVILPDGRHHTFAQFGSGTLRGVGTILSRFMLVNPLSMALEADHLEELTGVNPFNNTIVSKNCLLITPIHRAANRQREINRSGAPHGSCGQGIGEAQSFALTADIATLRVGDLLHPEDLREKLFYYRSRIEAELGTLDVESNEKLVERYAEFMETRNMKIVDDQAILESIREGYCVFEGSQGVLLDEWMGFHPHTTWSTTISQNAQTLLAEAGLPRGEVIGVLRSYMTRHGHGPLPSEFTDSDWLIKYPEEFNKRGVFQGAWRGGLFDLPLLRYALKITGGVDQIALSHLDRPIERAVVSYTNEENWLIPSFDQDLALQELLTKILIEMTGEGTVVDIDGRKGLIELIEKEVNVKVTIIASGPTSDDRFILA